MRFENLLTSSRYFSELKDLSLDVWPCKQNATKKTPKQLYFPKQMREDQLDDLELVGPNTLRILDGIVWDFTKAK